VKKNTVSLSVLVTLSFILVAGLRANNTHVPLAEFQDRRQKLVEAAEGMDAVILLAAAPRVERNNDVEYPYRQNSDLYYLTAWEQSQAILILRLNDEAPADIHFYVTPRNPKWEIWTGPGKGIDEAAEMLPDAEVHAIEDFWGELPRHLSGRSHLILSDGGDPQFRTRLDMELKHSRHAPDIVQEANTIIKQLRLIKSENELKDLQKAIDITTASLMDVFRSIPSLSNEYEVAAEIEYGFRRRGAERLGFPCIVGSGINGTYLHYEANNQELDHGGLILMDVGAEWGYYSADVTRTVPVDGTFNKAQRELYDIVLNAHLKAIEAVRPGAGFREPHKVAVREITMSLMDNGWLEGELDTLIAHKDYRRFFMHGTSHWLGLDVHDAGGYDDASGVPHILKPGMVLTVEPGIYIAPDLEGVPRKYREIGIRIEDDVLVTEDGFEVLSRSAPVQADEIEALMKDSRHSGRGGL